MRNGLAEIMGDNKSYNDDPRERPYCRPVDIDSLSKKELRELALNVCEAYKAGAKEKEIIERYALDQVSFLKLKSIGSNYSLEKSREENLNKIASADSNCKYEETLITAIAFSKSHLDLKERTLRSIKKYIDKIKNGSICDITAYELKKIETVLMVSIDVIAQRNPEYTSKIGASRRFEIMLGVLNEICDRERFIYEAVVKSTILPKSLTNVYEEYDNKGLHVLIRKYLESEVKYYANQSSYSNGDVNRGIAVHIGIVNNLKSDLLFKWGIDAEATIKNKAEETKAWLQNNTPDSIYKKLREYVEGQDDACRVVAGFAYTHVMRVYFDLVNSKGSGVRNNIMMIGPSGSGKTFIISRLTELDIMPSFIKIGYVDATYITPEDYQGESLSDVMKAQKMMIEKQGGVFRYSILFIDEAGKILGNSYSDSASVSSNLLTLLDAKGDVALTAGNGNNKSSITVGAPTISFVFADAMTEVTSHGEKASVGFLGDNTNQKYSRAKIQEKLTKLGFQEELVGRINSFVLLNPLTEEDVKRIILKGGHIPLSELVHAFDSELKYTDDSVDYLCKSVKSQTFGIRDMQGLITECFYELLSKGGFNKELIITRELLESHINNEVDWSKRNK